MKCAHSPKLCWIFALATSLSACGTSSNVNQIFGKDAESADAMLELARTSYDRGDFDKAADLANKLLDRNPDNEAAALVLGYTYLSMGGIDPYRLARELIALDSKDKKDPAAEASPEGGAGLQEDSSGKANDASSTLSQLGSLINLTDADFVTLSGNRLFSAADNNNVAPSLFATETNKLYIPAKVTEELRSQVEVLNYMNKAVKAVCRFVNNEVKTDDPRHLDPSCTQTTGVRNSPAKAHFLWAFSQLTESLVFQSVLLYSSQSSSTSNFQAASNAIDQKDFKGANALGEFVDKVTEIKNATDLVFDAGSSDSMLRATLSDLNAVTLAFDQIAGLPDGIKNRIVGALKKINEVGDTLGGGAENNAGALKGQMTEKFAKTIGGKVDTVVATQLEKAGVKSKDELNQMPDDIKKPILANITKACTSYDTLAKGLPVEKVEANKPKNCD